MKKLLLGICFILFTQILSAQSVRGKITDGWGNGIAAATIELENVGATITNDSGFFEFKRIRPGIYKLLISAIGYKMTEANVSASDSLLVLRMERWHLFMQPVEVKAIRAGDKAPFTKTNLTKKEIEKMNLGQDLPFILNQTPSVVVNSDAGNGIGYTAIRIRGSDATRINVTLNGIPYNDAESQGTFFVDLPDFSSSINSIQVQRGVGTSSNGGAAFGATINLSTHEINTNPYGEINNSFGSFNTWKNTIKAGTGLLNDHFTIDARFSRLTSNGFIERASSSLQSLYVSAAWLGENSSLRMNVFTGKEKTYQAWYGISEADLKTNRRINYAGTEKPGEPYDNETDNYQQDHYQLFFNHEFNKQFTFHTAFFLTNGKGYYEQYKAQQEFSQYGLPDFINGVDTIRKTDLIRQLWLDNHFYGQVFSLQTKSRNDELTLGGGWNRYDGKHFGEVIWAAVGIPYKYRWYYHEAYKTDVNMYSKYQRKLFPNLEAFADMQYRQVLYNINGFRDNPAVKIHNIYNFFNPKVGITYTHYSYQWYASYSLGQKEPNRDDFESGKEQQPKPERLHDFELGMENKTSRYSWSTTLYTMLYKNQLILTGKINDVGAYTRSNVPNSFRLGIELQGTARISSWLNVAGNLTLSRNRIENFTEYYDDYDNGGQKSIVHGNTDIAFSPGITGAATLNIIPVKNFEINLLSKYVGRQYLDNTSSKQRSLHPFYVQDVGLRYALKKFISKEINLVLQVNNVFNKEYEPNGYTFSYQYGGLINTQNYYYPMAGRNFMMAVNVKL